MMKNVIIGTPTLNGKLDVWYTNSLIETIKLSYSYNINIFPIFISYDSLIQRARNDLISMVIENKKIDELIFIDADIEWNSEDFFKLLSYNVDFVGGTYRLKTDEKERYVVKTDKIFNLDDKLNLIEVNGLGTGFLRLTRNCIEQLWNNTKEEYYYNNKQKKMIFNVIVENNDLISEDINLCNKWRKLNKKIYLDPTITCNHIGIKKYTGNFLSKIN